ncbi:MAG: ABC transporter substrate-binding protein [Bacteriovoracaceae bacterium]
MNSMFYPRSIVCLTEESVEVLGHLGRLDLVKGVSVFVKRPEEALQIPKVSYFTSSNLEKIVDLKPDLILGFSDIQKDIARDLIGLGLNVHIANHRTLQGILDYTLMLASLIGEREKGILLVDRLNRKMEQAQKSAEQLMVKPRVYFEEWDEPMISAIGWVSELIELAGGQDLFAHKSKGILAKDRFVSSDEVVLQNPQIILGCWCGKKVNLNHFKERPNWSNIEAIENSKVFELEPEIFLQPGPAPILDGLDLLYHILSDGNLKK